MLTLKLDPTSFERLQSLRQQHFPPRLNWLPAHVTLLHTLSAEQVDRLVQVWDVLGARPSLPMRYGSLRFLGRGVAVAVESAALQAFRSALMQTVAGPFTRQDLAPHRAHATIQNKVEPAAARRLFDELARDFVPWTGAGEGVFVWRYLGGPWELDSTLDFNRLPTPSGRR